MPDGSPMDWLSLFLLVMSAILSGASGAVLVVAHKVLRGRNITTMLIMAHIIVGLVLGLAMLLYIYAFMDTPLSFSKTVFYCLFMGGIGSGALASVGVASRWRLRWQNIEVELNLKEHKPEESKSENKPN